MTRKTLTILSLIGLLLSVMLGRRYRKWKRTRDDIRRAKDSGTLCAGCGYNMEGQTIPRCPECGALRGFTTSVDQLGLTEEEIRAGFERKREARNLPSQQKRDASHRA